MPMTAPFPFLPSILWHRGALSGILAVLLTGVFELTCLDAVHKLRCTQHGRALYTSALRTNVVNNIGLGTITYYVTVSSFCQPNLLPVTDQVQAMLGIVVIQAVLYYLIHKAFHEVKGLYWMHSYHHKFNTVVLPSTANAVSVYEYAFAYMVPLVCGVAVTRADETATFLGAAIVGVTNILIHTPWLEHQKYPWMLVTAGDHLSHHRKTRGNYGAPVFHLDRIVERCSSTLSQKKNP